MVTLTSIKFESKQNKTTSRTVSFNKTYLSETSKSDGIYEDAFEESTSCKKRKIGELTLGTNVSSYNTEGHCVDKFKPDYWISPRSPSELDEAATKLQKVYKSYRTRRNLADCTVIVGELWWKALDFAALRQSSVSFFDSVKAETAVSRWARARTRAAKVGKGLSKDEKAQKLALRHWLEAIDPRHRYGQNLYLYYDVWFNSGSFQPFFYWLDVGDGKEVNLDKCPRTELHHQCIKYLGPKERDAYEVIVESGKLMYKQSGNLVNTPEGSKWIFVLSTSRNMYVGEKKKGLFQHSSFLAGGATIAAGRLVALNGLLEAVWSYSGHYHPTEENFMEFISFLEELHVDLTDVKKYPIDDDIPPSSASKK
ncbi:IQ domain-containing protein IQM1-like [Rosa rugosa]|uniref:IQ domain-containing protein IQM1-like n=1 Tax=Rosa rugosa TaxID=74645 RepID=UPI002B40682F|nr:IQ domain-containing protein IQM1-like [Rosa rugosa]